MTTPARSPIGVASAAITAPTTSGHAAEPRPAASPAPSRWATSSAMDIGRGRWRYRVMATPMGTSASCTIAPPSDGQALNRALAGARHVLEVGRRDHRLPGDGAQQFDERVAARAVELAHHVVEQHQRRRAATVRDRLALGEQQREQAEPLLTLRAVDPQLAALPDSHELVAVRAVPGEATLDVARRALGELRRQLRRRPSPGARPVRDRHLGPSPSSSAIRANTGLIASTASRRSAISSIPYRASCASHARSESRDPPPARIRRSGRCAGRAPGRRRAGRRPAPATGRRRTDRDGRGAATERP